MLFTGTAPVLDAEDVNVRDVPGEDNGLLVSVTGTIIDEAVVLVEPGVGVGVGDSAREHDDSVWSDDQRPQ